MFGLSCQPAISGLSLLSVMNSLSRLFLFVKKGFSFSNRLSRLLAGGGGGFRYSDMSLPEAEFVSFLFCI